LFVWLSFVYSDRLIWFCIRHAVVTQSDTAVSPIYSALLPPSGLSNVICRTPRRQRSIATEMKGVPQSVKRKCSPRACALASRPLSTRRWQLHLLLARRRDVTERHRRARLRLAASGADWQPLFQQLRTSGPTDRPSVAVSIIHTALARYWSLLAIIHRRPNCIASIKRTHRLASFRMRTSLNLSSY